ncbi:MAG: ABC transporter ATP-binding protein [Xanthomonadales bacterium]|jgi:iron complex transport system ATP-binding protein|nr:ABC transporter ATP-binding protein [Xanthomonadales bacterium]
MTPRPERQSPSGTDANGVQSLEVEGLGVRIGSTTVVEGLDLVLEGGAYWGMLGPNGVGKTTLLRHLAGLVRPAAGQVSLGGRPLDHWPRRQLAQRLGMLQQHTAYVFDASVRDVALTGRHPHLGAWQRESAEDRALADAALGRVDLGALADRSVTSLSGGEARRLAFATLLVQDPDILLLDEPTNHLDFRHQVRLMRTIGDRIYRDGHSGLAALHDVNLAATYCSHVLMLFGDGAWEAGKATELLTSERLERLYQCPVTAVDTAEGRRFHPAFSSSGGDGSSSSTRA